MSRMTSLCIADMDLEGLAALGLDKDQAIVLSPDQERQALNDLKKPAPYAVRGYIGTKVFEAWVDKKHLAGRLLKNTAKVGGIAALCALTTIGSQMISHTNTGYRLGPKDAIAGGPSEQYSKKHYVERTISDERTFLEAIAKYDNAWVQYTF